MGRLVIVGLDGATFDLIRPWASEGKLPALARLLGEGASAPLRSVMHPYSAQAWTTLVTGANAGKHRLFDFWERDPATYGYRMASARRRALPAIWTLLSQAGRRSIVVNVPMSYPPEAIEGVMVSGWDTPGLASHYTFPRELKSELAELAGQPYMIVPDDWKYSVAGRSDLALAELLREIDVHFAVVEGLARREPWELCFFVIGAPDGATHFLWNFHDSAHPLYDPVATQRLFVEDPMLQVYRRVDDRLGQFLGTLNPDDHVLVVSDHGVGALGDLEIHLNLWLAAEGLLALRTPGSSRSVTESGRALAAAVVGWGKRQLHGRVSFETLALLRGLWPNRLRAALSESEFFPDVDWSRTQAYSEEVRGNIWLNVRGREPGGIVEPGAQYEELRSAIASRLSALVDPRTGEPLIRRVWRREELFSGPHANQTPDLLLEVEYPDIFRPRGRRREGPAVRALTREEMRERVSGCHRKEGIFIAHGPGIRAGAEVTTADITAVAPTALYLLGEPVPSWMDGSVLTEIFTAEHLSAHPMALGSNAWREDDSDLAPPESDDAGVLRDRLEKLGYL